MGGKKKKTTNVVKKDSKYKIPRSFDCPICDAKASIQIKVTKATGSAKGHTRVWCRACAQPNPPLEGTWPSVTKNHHAVVEFDEWLRKEDQEQLERENIAVHPTELNYAKPQALECGPGDAKIDDEHDDEIVGITGASF
jgi:transcription elongation factor Elf1